MDLLDIHARKIKVNIRKFNKSKPVILIDPQDNEYPGILGHWNDVEHALKMDNITDSAMGAKSSIYFDTDTLFNLGITPTTGWKLTGSPNKYDPVKTYFLEIPKIDRQLPGQLFFLSEKKDVATAWKGAR